MRSTCFSIRSGSSPVCARERPREAGMEGPVNGYQITFFTVQGHRHKGKPVADWLVHIAKEMGLTGATLIGGSEGFGHHRRMHSVHFIELTDQPLEVVMILGAEEADRLFD